MYPESLTCCKGYTELICITLAVDVHHTLNSHYRKTAHHSFGGGIFRYF